MARPRKNPARTPADIMAEIADEEAHHALLVRDLRDALLAGEDTRSYRRALAETEVSITALRAALDELRHTESAQRQMASEAEAAAITAEAHARHAALLEPLAPPPFPLLFKGNHDVA